MRLRITRIAFLYHNVTDIVRARNFYERVLGMKVGLEYEGAPGKSWIEYDVDGVTFAITNIGSRKGEGGTLPAFEVADIEAAAATLRTAGATFIEPVTEYPRCRSFTVADPDGNQIGFHQLKPGTDVPKFSLRRAQEAESYLHTSDWPNRRASAEGWPWSRPPFFTDRILRCERKRKTGLTNR